MEEGRKRVLGIMASILVSRHLKTTEDLHDSRPSPRTESLVGSAVQWAESNVRNSGSSVVKPPNNIALSNADRSATNQPPNEKLRGRLITSLASGGSAMQKPQRRRRQNGLYKRQYGVFCFRYKDKHGIWREKSTSETDRAEALAFKKDWDTRNEDGTLPADKANWTVAQACTRNGSNNMQCDSRRRRLGRMNSRT
jgi:hypothetical protein